MPEPQQLSQRTPESSDRQVVVVTGGSRGIGAHLVRAFADAGHAVELCARDGDRARSLAAELVAAGHDVVGATLDVTNAAAVDAYVRDVVERRGRIDVLVNNAGLIEPPSTLWDADVETWERVLRVNVLGPFLVSRAVAPHLLAAGGGRVINLNSGAGTRSAPDQSAYHAGKTALARITGGLHLAGREHGLRAFDLAPGVVVTDMTTAMPQDEGRTEWTDPADVTTLALALASGELDAWSGRLVRAGVDTVASLQARAAEGLGEHERTIGLLPYGPDDPLG
ncbi:SDR family oxidoreductase [Arsenicicoccus piscis]|uniref:Short-chain dehydrogenase n=1 Tax=Arsenicicoccus piscis TaxID=673954 RepID=A0ABQ6HND1_9MICO|nr:SDR family oxidoreductase [Arsenicicoccus piscis]MCH8627067.1 SDR family oxidoreductase [Arsenicicoccus piscis]GMA18994.1 short-chain dehydrogenase [Arsenicicoccus piscis]